MAVAPANSEKLEPSPSKPVSDVASSATSPSPSAPAASYSSGRLSADFSSASPSPSTPLEQQLLKSEEYRQLFRLSLEEVLIQDFNCALQENFLLQGHMYIFTRNICFYSNLFGFETKKIIPFIEITSLRRAKTAAIFPTAIEILAGGKKYFFTSFLSRDEAFKIINDGWLQHSNADRAITEQQELRSGSSRENGNAIVEKLESSQGLVETLEFTERVEGLSVSEDPGFQPNGLPEIVLKSSQVQAIVEDDLRVVPNADCSPSGKSLVWVPTDSDAPEVPKCYTMVAQSKLPVTLEEFFNLFFSDSAVDFLESFRSKCGEKEFSCTSWKPHNQYGHTREVSFQHPIKIYFGAKFGGCHEVQKCQLYRNGHLVIETSQDCSDVPYGDYFRVQGIWDVERISDESKDFSILRVYIEVAFLKNTMFKGKIVQSTLEECRDAYAIWIDLAHKLLTRKQLEKEEAGNPVAGLIPNGEIQKQVESGDLLESSNEENQLRMSETHMNTKDINQTLPGSLCGVTSASSFFKDFKAKVLLSLKSQGHIPVFIVVIVAMTLLLMQISIVVLLARQQPINVIAPADLGTGQRGTETVTFLEKRIHHLRDEMLMVETLLEKMQHEVALLKLQLKDLELLRKQQR